MCVMLCDELLLMVCVIYCGDDGVCVCDDVECECVDECVCVLMECVCDVGCEVLMSVGGGDVVWVFGVDIV